MSAPKFTQTKRILARIEQSYSIGKDEEQPAWLVHEIQYQLGCSYGKAICYANEIRCRNKLVGKTP